MSAGMLAEAEGARGESSVEDDAFALPAQAHVEVANEKRCRWSKDREPESLDVGGLGVVAMQRRDDSSTP
jgi:hypothetical protein